MERLTDCAQGYCEMYCKKYMLCFEDPEDCTFKDEIKLYDAIKSIEGIVPFDRLLELACADKAGRLVVLPCKVGEYWRDWDGERVRIESVSFSFTRGHLCNTDMVTYRYDDEEDDFAVNWIYFKSHFTREEAEAALAQKGGKDHA